MTIILESQTQLVKQITQLIKKNKITPQQFRSLTVLSDKWIHTSVEAGELQDVTLSDCKVAFQAQT
jgi:hypothetical protein